MVSWQGDADTQRQKMRSTMYHDLLMLRGLSAYHDLIWLTMTCRLRWKILPSLTLPSPSCLCTFDTWASTACLCPTPTKPTPQRRPKCPKCLRCLDYPWQHHPVSRERPSSCLGSWWKEATSPTPAATWISALGPLGRSSGYNMRPPGTRGSSCTCLLISILKSSLS